MRRASQKSPRRGSGAHQAVHQRPRQHKAAEALEQAAGPHLAGRAVEVGVRAAVGAQREDQGRRQERSDEVEGEARVRLEAQGAGGHAEQRGGEVAHVGDGLAPAC